MKIAVLGSETIFDQDLIDEIVQNVLFKSTDVDNVLITNGQPGVSVMAEETFSWCDQTPPDVILPESDSHEHLIDNAKKIINKSDVFIVVWDGEDGWVKDSIEYGVQKEKLKSVNYVYK